jgi:hypothetical protein
MGRFGSEPAGLGPRRSASRSSNAYSFEVNYPSQEYARYRALFDQILASVEFTGS